MVLTAKDFYFRGRVFDKSVGEMVWDFDGPVRIRVISYEDDETLSQARARLTNIVAIINRQHEYGEAPLFMTELSAAGDSNRNNCKFIPF